MAHRVRPWPEWSAPLALAGKTTATLTYMPARNFSSGLASVAWTRILRVAASTSGLMAVIVAGNNLIRQGIGGYPDRETGVDLGQQLLGQEKS